MRIIGFDQALITSGYAVIDELSNDLVEYGIFKIKTRQPLELRLLDIYEKAEEIIDACKPDLIVIEDCFLYKGFSVAQSLGMVQAVFLLLSASKNIEVTKVQAQKARGLFPTTANKACRTKEDMRSIVNHYYKLDLEDCNITDAIVLARYGLHYMLDTEEFL